MISVACAFCGCAKITLTSRLVEQTRYELWWSDCLCSGIITRKKYSDMFYHKHSIMNLSYKVPHCLFVSTNPHRSVVLRKSSGTSFTVFDQCARSKTCSECKTNSVCIIDVLQWWMANIINVLIIVFVQQGYLISLLVYSSRLGSKEINMHY